MQSALETVRTEALAAIAKATTLAELDVVDITYAGRKEGKLTELLRGLKDLSPEEKKVVGPLANAVKNDVSAAIVARRQDLERVALDATLAHDTLDVTLPGKTRPRGHLHPNSIVQYELEDVFTAMGFMIADGPELESDYFNFEALNVPAHHPARDMQDTFYVNAKTLGTPVGDEKIVLRTQTSNAQVRTLLKYGAPLRAVIPGRVFRYEDIDASHENTFYQMEGMMVDKNISIANLLAVMKTLLRSILKRDVTVRLRPGFFPFVEPGFELDIQCLVCGGPGCSVCKHSGWVELLPCGMIHPNVLKAGGVDPNIYSGFAFGLGLTRMVMMRYGLDHIRLLNSGDLRFLQQF
jgi:phenylalanyl-tRNA synthetase alpha chain